MNTKLLLQQLQKDVAEIASWFDTHIANAEEKNLKKKPNDTSWNIIEIVDHLNFYNDWYLPKLKAAITKAKQEGHVPKTNYTPGWLGNYFTKLMQPDATGNISKKMKSPSNALPKKHLHTQKTVDDFAKALQTLKSLLKEAEAIDIASKRVPTSLSSWVRLKIGDTFRFVIAHIQRHQLQIKKIIAAP